MKHLGMLNSRPAALLFWGAAGIVSLLLATPARATAEPLRYGSSGNRVARLQRELKSVSYPTGPVDGQFGYKTFQAVVGFEKVHRLKRDGIVPARELRRIRRAKRPRSRARAVADFIDVDISRQVLFDVRNGRVRRTIPVSTGSGELYKVDGTTYRARTPRGSFRIERKIRGWRHARLGDLYFPSYFYYGYALHGSESVPTYPASHGCIRLPMYVTRDFYRRNPVGRFAYIHE